jgi:16S rRNA G1207 methylase RsmC
MDKRKKEFDIKRYDLSTDRSLRAYSAADEYLLHHFTNLDIKPTSFAIFNDRFGFLACHLHAFEPTVVLTHKSQERAMHLNLKTNNCPDPTFSYPLSTFDKEIDFALLKVPKSLAIFELFLYEITRNSLDDLTVIASFMTRHFSPNLLSISQKYFEKVEQSKAVKKARLMTLSQKKQVPELDLIDVINYNNQDYKQYWGVFSAKHIDYGTQYFLEHMELNPDDKYILDLASGNGILACEIQKKLANAEIHLMDDAYLAVESAKLNIQGKNIHHHFNNEMSIFEDGTLDLIVTNPPFHFEYEINIKIPLQLFKECYRCLKRGGNLQIVANNHLNYKTHLIGIFPLVEILSQNEKFVIYKCIKAT